MGGGWLLRCCRSDPEFPRPEAVCIPGYISKSHSATAGDAEQVGHPTKSYDLTYGMLTGFRLI